MSTFTCDTCGSPEVLAIRPGAEAETIRAGRHTITLRRAIPDRMWCADCWPALHPAPPPSLQWPHEEMTHG